MLGRSFLEYRVDGHLACMADFGEVDEVLEGAVGIVLKPGLEVFRDVVEAREERGLEGEGDGTDEPAAVRGEDDRRPVVKAVEDELCEGSMEGFTQTQLRFIKGEDVIPVFA